MTKNSAASVRARLTNQARATQRPFQEVLQHYGLERFLYRLTQSSHGVRFVLKGALLLRAWGVPMSRPTRDVDFLGYLDNDIAVVETVVAEKFEAMVHLGSLNSRMKDFFDLWLLARQFEFAGPDLALAIAKTFTHRATQLEAEPIALTAAFTSGENAQKQWAAFLRRSQLDEAPKALEDLRAPLRAFLLPVVTALMAGRTFDTQWIAGAPGANSRRAARHRGNQWLPIRSAPPTKFSGLPKRFNSFSG